MMIKAKEFIVFAFISLFGLVFDILIFLLLLKYLDAYAANYLSSICASMFVYCFSMRFSFGQKRRSLLGMAAWIVFQIFSIAFFSYVVSFLYVLTGMPLLVKIIVIPLSFIVNFLFAKYFSRKLAS